MPHSLTTILHYAITVLNCDITMLCLFLPQCVTQCSIMTLLCWIVTSPHFLYHYVITALYCAITLLNATITMLHWDIIIFDNATTIPYCAITMLNCNITILHWFFIMLYCDITMLCCDITIFSFAPQCCIMPSLCHVHAELWLYNALLCHHIALQH